MPVELSAVTKVKNAELAAYERLLTDAILGAKMLYVRVDAVEVAWKIVDRILDKATSFLEYAPEPGNRLKLLELQPIWEDGMTRSLGYENHGYVPPSERHL